MCYSGLTASAISVGLLSSMAVGRPHFHIVLILSVKMLFITGSLREGCGWELGGKVLES